MNPSAATRQLMHRLKTVVSAAFSLVLLATSASVLAAQEIQGLPGPTRLASQSLRPYWHVFIAYSIAILLVFGWVISIARRLRDVEERLGK